MNRISIFDSLLKRSKNVPFLKRSNTSDKKFTMWSNKKKLTIYVFKCFQYLTAFV